MRGFLQGRYKQSSYNIAELLSTNGVFNLGVLSPRSPWSPKPQYHSVYFPIYFDGPVLDIGSLYVPKCPLLSVQGSVLANDTLPGAGVYCEILYPNQNHRIISDMP